MYFLIYYDLFLLIISIITINHIKFIFLIKIRKYYI